MKRQLGAAAAEIAREKLRRGRRDIHKAALTSCWEASWQLHRRVDAARGRKARALKLAESAGLKTMGQEQEHASDLLRFP